MTDSNSSHQCIRLWRQYHKLSQQQLADLVGVTRVTISNWESGKYKPQKSAWARFEKAALKINAAHPRLFIHDHIMDGGSLFLWPTFLDGFVAPGLNFDAFYRFTQKTKEEGK